MVGEERVLEILDRVLRASPGDQTEVRFSSSDNSLTRYANSLIHQNVSERNVRLTVKVYLGKKMGAFSTNRLDDESVMGAVKGAADIARFSPENPEFVSLPGPRPLPSVKSCFESTAEATPEVRAENVLKIINRAKRSGFEAAGAHLTNISETAVGNSLGVMAYGKATSADLTCVIMSDEGSGFARASSRDLSRIDGEKVAEEAALRCELNRKGVDLEPGEYPVILEPYAVGELFSFLGGAFSAAAHFEGRSPLSGRMGSLVISPLLSVVDDGLDPEGMPFPFDGEGQPKSRIVLVEDGRAKNVVYDSFSAFREGKKESTGHGSGWGGGSPSNMFVTGSKVVGREDLLSGLDEGVLVTRFHYVRTVHSQKTMITGMTRDGTFLVENGKIKGAVKNLRFTESILRALEGVVGVSEDRQLCGNVMVPALHLEKFNFTGQADH